jgi:hypothetical protein
MLIAILLLAIVLSACIASNAQQSELSSFSKLSEIIARWRLNRSLSTHCVHQQSRERAYKNQNNI